MSDTGKFEEMVSCWFGKAKFYEMLFRSFGFLLRRYIVALLNFSVKSLKLCFERNKFRYRLEFFLLVSQEKKFLDFEFMRILE